MTLAGQTILRSAALAALLACGSPALAQGGAAGQGGLSPDTPVLAPTQPGPGGAGAAPGGAPSPGSDASPGPKTPLPPRDTPRAPQPGQSAGDGPKTALPPRDTPRAQQPGQRAAATDPDWPCVQVKVATLSYGQMWGGPPIEQAFKTWRDDPKVADLVADLAARRTKMEDAKAMIAAFAKEAGEDRNEKLAKLFAGAFEEINTQRTQIVTGIERYSRKQRTLSERIKAESLKLASEQQDMATQNSPEAMQKQQALDWDTRIYEERSQSLVYVCESPVILEQRAFDLGREIQSHLAQSGQ